MDAIAEGVTVTNDPAFSAYENARKAGSSITACLRAYQDVWLKQPHMVAKMEELNKARRDGASINERTGTNNEL